MLTTRKVARVRKKLRETLSRAATVLMQSRNSHYFSDSAVIKKIAYYRDKFPKLSLKFPISKSSSAPNVMSNRQRGIVLTNRGLERLETAIATAQDTEKYGKRFTQAELAERTDLSIKTVQKIRKLTASVDETSVQSLFTAFGLKLETADYGLPEFPLPVANQQSRLQTAQSTAKIDWGEKPDTAIFFGRTAALTTLSQWVTAEQCRLVTLLGMGGIGKTSLAAKLADQIYGQFDYVIWRSLREAPPLDEILVRLIQFLSDQQETEINLPTRLGERIIRLLHYLREHRCLLVLDNLESILQPESTGQFRDGYEGYGELIHRIGEADHRSCLLLTSRECPRELAPMAGDHLPVRLWSVTGIDAAAGQEILKAKGLDLAAADTQGQELIDRYSGNPQALHLVATAIQREFLGDVDDFLAEEGAAVEDVRTLLDQHLTRLAPLERSILFWLAINREPVGVDELMEDLLPPVTKQEVRSALRGLSDRYLIETVGKQFTLQNVIMEFTTDRFVETVSQELETQQFDLFHTHALIKATAKDYVRETQIRLILMPIESYINDDLELQVADSLQTIRQNFFWPNGYASGNLLNLLCQIQFLMRNCNFSDLTLRQAHLKGAQIETFNMSNTLFVKPSLTHTISRICSVVFQPSGKLLVAGDGNGIIHLWCPENQKQVATIDGHKAAIRSMAFSPDGRLLASGSEDNTTRIWDFEKRQCLKVLAAHKSSVSSVAFSSNGKLLATGGEDCTVQLWKIDNYECICTLKKHTNIILSLAFSPNGQLLATAGGDATVQLWDIQNLQCLHTFTAHTKWVRSVAFSPNGQLLATGSEDTTVRLWNVHERKCLYTFTEHTSLVLSLAFSADGKLLATGSGNGSVRLWNIQNYRCLHIFNGHQNWVWSVAFSPDICLLATGGEDNSVKLWDINRYQCFYTFKGYTNWVRSVAFSPDNRVLISGSEDSKVRIWDLQKRHCLYSLSDQNKSIRSVSFSPDGRLLASVGNDSMIRLWNIKKRRYLYTLSGQTNSDQTNWLLSVAFSPDGQLLAAGGSDKAIQLWEVPSRQCIHVFKGHNNWIREVTFSPDGQFLASCSEDATVRLWDIQTQTFLHTFLGHNHSVWSVAFSPNSQMLASSSGDSTIRLWDVQKRTSIYTFLGHNYSVRSVAFSPNAEILASGGGDTTVRLWNIQKRCCTGIFIGHHDWVRSVNFSPDGEILASCSNDGTIRLWDVSSGECLASLQIPGPYEGTNITGVQGLTEAQRASMLALGAVDHSSNSSAAGDVGFLDSV
ncbi:MAG: NB-ARC domain-containing protein [Cyanobacteria bacterium P01_C01_bin.120]